AVPPGPAGAVPEASATPVAADPSSGPAGRSRSVEGRLHHFVLGPLGFPSSMLSPQLAHGRPTEASLPEFNQVCESARRVPVSAAG
ncbi:hypothetical protein ACFWZV_35600, partial [[Kitasatospora] papulosa]